MKNITILLFIAFALTSCSKEEEDQLVIYSYNPDRIVASNWDRNFIGEWDCFDWTLHDPFLQTLPVNMIFSESQYNQLFMSAYKYPDDSTFYFPLQRNTHILIDTTYFRTHVNDGYYWEGIIINDSTMMVNYFSDNLNGNISLIEADTFFKAP
jgi:hypothetical protein